MATYKEIQDYISKKYGIKVKTCWIAHMKELCGLPLRQAPNRNDPSARVFPCPENVQKYIKEAFEHFKMLP